MQTGQAAAARLETGGIYTTLAALREPATAQGRQLAVGLTPTTADPTA